VHNIRIDVNVQVGSTKSSLSLPNPDSKWSQSFPADMFGFDMLANGVRGFQVLDDNVLSKYGEYIAQLFAAWPPKQHNQIINNDRAVRIGQRRDLKLTDFNAFLHFQHLHKLMIRNTYPALSKPMQEPSSRHPK
jgi:hypothetical protein